MATNDLMMKIQLLVESGKSTAELDRLSKSLKQLTSELNSLETTKITPLTRDLQEIKQVAQTLRNVNISNFGKSLDNIKQSMIGLGVGTSNLDKLRESYQRLDTQLKSKNADNFRAQIEKSSLLAKTYSDGLVVLQGKLRQLSAEKSLDKALRVDTLSASLRVARAEAANLRNEINKLVQKKLDNKDVLSQDDSNQLQKYRSDLQRLNDTIVKDNVNLAKTNQEITKSYNEQIAQKNRQVVLSRNYLNIENNKLKTLNEQLKAETNKEKSIQRQITYYSKLTTSDALAKSLELQQQLAQSKTNQVDLKKQVADTESLTKAELARIQAMEKANTTAMKKANAEIKNQSGNLTTLGRLFGKSVGAVREFGDAIFFAFGPQMAGFIAAAVIANAVREVTVAFFEANKSVENLLRGLNAISGGQGVVLFDQLVDSANRLGIPLKQVSQSFLEVQAATIGTNFEGQKTKELFDALANALTVTGADAVQFNRGFRAMGQILSKDQLYAEELRQQLSEALPGAVQVFARALDVSPKQLLRFIESGAIEGDNLRRTLALVTKELEKTYKVANEQDFTFTQKAALAQNALNLLLVELGNTGIWRAFGNVLLYARDQFVALGKSIPSLSDSFKTEFAIIANIVSGGSEEINNSLNNIEPTFNFETLKKQIGEIGSLINDGALGWLRSIAQFADDASLIIKNFYTKLGNQPQKPLFTIGVEDEKLFSFLDKINQYTPGVKLRELFSQYLEDIKKLSSTPLEITTEVIPDSFEKFKKDFIEFNRNAEIDFTINDKQLINIYNEYLARINRTNTAIREQNALNEQTNKILQQNTIESTKAADNRLAEEGRIRANAAAMEVFRKAQKDANALQQIYDIDLNYQATLKAKSLQISKEQAKLDKELLKIQNDYNDAIMEVTANKYKRWAEQGQITQEGADFLIQSAKGESARKAWNQAQDAVDSYNAAVKEGSGVSKDTIDILKQQASELLSIAANRAKEIGDEYKLKQAYDAQKSLLEEQKKQIGGIENVLSKAEGAGVKTELKPIEDKTVSSLVNGVQEQINNLPQPMITVGVQLENNGITQSLDLNPTESRARGGLIPGGYSNRDSVHALLAPGEFVIPSNIVKALSPSFFYDLIRSRGLKIPQVNARENITIPHFAAGGLVQQSAQPIIINAAGKQIHLSGSREAANQLAKLLTQTGRAL